MPRPAPVLFNDCRRSRWAFNGGVAIDEILDAANVVRLLDARFLLSLADRGELVKPREALPEIAFMSHEDLKANSRPSELPIIVISAMWLSPDHPDPYGAHLARLASALRHYCTAQDRWGVF